MKNKKIYGINNKSININQKYNNCKIKNRKFKKS